MTADFVVTMRRCTVPLLSLAVALAAPAPAAAQERPAPARPEYERELARLQRDVAALQREQQAAEWARSRAEAEAVLREMEPRLRRSAQELDRLRARLAEEQGRAAAADPELRRLARDLSGLQRGFTYDRVSRISAPAGWLGISYSGIVEPSVGAGGVVLVYRDYPVVESVEPGSPAAAAGIERGDTIIAYNGRDVQKSKVWLNKLLRPGARVVVRVRRAGKTRELPVTVGRRPAAYAGRTPSPMVMVVPDVRVEVRERPPRAPRPPHGVASVAPTPGAPPAPAVAPTPPAPPMPPMPLIYGGPAAAVAGAEVVRMTDDLRDAFGGRRGVLVLAVAAGTPAAQAGLRGGDVILRVGKSAVTSPLALQRAIERAEGRSVEMEVMRKQRTRRVVLAW